MSKLFEILNCNIKEMSVDPIVCQYDIKKKLFALKPMRKDGLELILQIHHSLPSTDKNKNIRFTHVSFNKLGHILAAVDHTGSTSIIDFLLNKFWTLPPIGSCSALKFSNVNDNELIIGTYSGKLCILCINTGIIVADLIGHNHPIMQISFSHNKLCLTSSKCEAIIWDLKTYSKMQVLCLESNAELKHMVFMPVTSNILGCFHDDSVHIWKIDTFESYQQILPTSWNKQPLKCVAFTRNGRAMILGGHSPIMTVFLLDSWSVAKVIALPEYIKGIKKLDFIPQPFDGGSNRILAILSSNGTMYFYDMEQDIVLSKIHTEQEIIRFDSSINGKHIACVLSSGEANIYNVLQYVTTEGNRNGSSKETLKSNSKTSLSVRKTSSRLLSIQKQLSEILDVNKLKSILKEFGQYPENYRVKIWTQLLQLPNNKQQYNATINRTVSCNYFSNLEQIYPLTNIIALKNLKKLLANLVSWCPFFSQVTYLPVLVFPFVKVFKNEPVLCFEAMCSVIVNWCQHWYEYFPLPPINVLAMIENLLHEHEPEILYHFVSNNITAQIYAWPLLESAFSEVLSATDWCILWDHIISNEPAFLLMTVVAYIILHRTMLISINSGPELVSFYHQQNATDLKRLVAKSYILLQTTTDTMHPRQYLTYFTKLDLGTYPTFLGYPKTVVDCEFNKMQAFKREGELLNKEEEKIMKLRRSESDKLSQFKRNQEENSRLKELEKVYKEKVQEEHARVQQQRQRLLQLRKQLHQEEIEILNASREQIIQRNTKQRQKELEKLLNDVEYGRNFEEFEIVRAEGAMINHYSELLKHQAKIEELLGGDTTVEQRPEHKDLHRHQQKLAAELQKIQKDVNSKTHLKQLNVATGIAAMDDLIQKVEVEIARDIAEKYEDIDKAHYDAKRMKLEGETRELENQVGKLLNQLTNMRLKESLSKISELDASVHDRDLSLHNRMANLERKESKISNYSGDLRKLKELITSARDGYEGRPATPTLVDPYN